MSQNETLIQVPSTLEEPLALRKFLLQLVEKLDIILGYRGQDPYLKNTDLQLTTETLKALPTDVNNVKTNVTQAQTDITDLKSEVENLTEEFDTLQTTSFTAVNLSASYAD